jgi:hypothetical protein
LYIVDNALVAIDKTRYADADTENIFVEQFCNNINDNLDNVLRIVALCRDEFFQDSVGDITVDPACPGKL